MTPRIAFTMGYQGIDVDALARTAKEAGVTMVVDTRRHPTSRRPAYRREALRAQLAIHGLGYESRPGLGVPARIRPLAKSRRRLFEAAYRGVLTRADESGELDATIRSIAEETVALLCFESEPGQCHRSLLARAISTRSPVTFVDLHPGRVQDADDHPGGRMRAVGAQHQV